MHSNLLADILSDLDSPIMHTPRIQHYAPPRIQDPVPSKLSPEWKAALDELFVGLNDLDDVAVRTAREAADHIGNMASRVDLLQDIAKRNRIEVEEVRDLYKNKDLIRTADAAKEKLHTIKVQERFLVVDALGRNMQSLVSYHNGKKDGKRFKTKRIDSATPVFEVWRTR